MKTRIGKIVGCICRVDFITQIVNHVQSICQYIIDVNTHTYSVLYKKLGQNVTVVKIVATDGLLRVRNHRLPVFLQVSIQI